MSITKVKDPDGIVHLVVQRTWQAYCGRFMYVGDVVQKTNPPLSCIACIIKPSPTTAAP
jgi:hypothetical protein